MRRCKNGHDLSDPASRYGRNCRICHGARMREAHRRRAEGQKLYQPTREERIGSVDAMYAIFALDDRLSRNDYLNVTEADEIRRTIATLSRRVVT